MSAARYTTAFQMHVTLLLFSIAVPVSASWPHWFPNPWSTTTPVPLTSHIVKDFARGCADTLGFEDGVTCLKDVNASAVDFYEAERDYFRGGWENKAKAMVKFAESSKDIMDALKPCNKQLVDARKYKTLVKELEDPKYYTVHNALTLLLNAVEERGEFKAFAAAWQKKQYRTAGTEFMTALLDILSNPGIPASNGTAAIEFAHGFAEGFSSDVELDCFKDVRIEIPVAVSGVFDLLTLRLVSGLENIFQALTGAVPTFKACMADKQNMINMLHSFGDFAHPKQMAKIIGANVVKNDLDLTVEIASAVLDYKGKEWERFGQDIGKILGQIFMANMTTTAQPTELDLMV